MPDDANARDGLPHSNDDSPDLVEEELGDGAKIWRVYDRVAREEDRERIGNWNRGLDNLALFAGLFSAVTTAFIIQLQQDIQPDYAHLTFLVLNSSFAGVAFRHEPFVIDSSIRTTNCLWIASLMLSLTAALIAIMGKDWIGTYASRPVCNPRQWAEIRTYRLACVNRWYMSGVIASAPVLLHLSLVLFAAGLVIFVAPDPFSQRVALGLALAAGGLYLVIVISAIVFPTSPFRSPATQAIRGTVGSICALTYNRLVYRPKRHPVEMLQQVTLLISSALSYPLPSSILPFDRLDRRRLRTRDIGMLWNHLSSGHSSGQGLSWRDSALLIVKDSWARWTSFALSLPVRVRSAVDEYRYVRQRPRTRPWHISAKTYLRQIDLSDRWAAVRSQPTPNLMAESLSHLNAMTQSTDVFRSILVALGDIAVGREVAPLVSFDLKSRLASEMRHTWQKCDLIMLSRYMLADAHLWDTSLRLIPGRAVERFAGKDTVQSESIAFALVERNFGNGSMLDRHCPDLVIQPRALQYLLPDVSDLEFAIVLAQRYWDYLETDQSVDLNSTLRRLLVYSAHWDDIEAKLHRCFGDPGLLELLVVSLDYMDTNVVKIACALILKVVSSTYPTREQSCLVYAFGHPSRSITDAAWTALPEYQTWAQTHVYVSLELSLPLARFARVQGVTAPVSQDQRAIEMCLARTIVLLLFPTRYFHNTEHVEVDSESDPFPGMSTLQLCIRGLCTQLCHHRSALDSWEKLEVITIMLEKSVLIRICALWKRRFLTNIMPTTERYVINILTAISRQLATMLACKVADDYDTGARLFCLFSFSEAKDWEDKPVAWDLGSYLRGGVHRLYGRDTSIVTSMCRLVRALRALRPLCAPRDDLRAAWERIGLTLDDDYQDPFWDAEDFDLGPLLDPDVPTSPLEGAAPEEETIVPVVIEEFSALQWLDAAMR